MESSEQETPTSEGEKAAAISNAVVHLFTEYYGRGPTRAKTYLFEDFATCVLEDTMTTVERTLVECGRHNLVRDVRLAFQAEMADSFTSAVENVMGRKVLGYHSQITFDPEYCFEIFVLEPEDGPAG